MCRQGGKLVPAQPGTSRPAPPFLNQSMESPSAVPSAGVPPSERVRPVLYLRDLQVRYPGAEHGNSRGFRRARGGHHHRKESAVVLRGFKNRAVSGDSRL
jgi:hypothetical protein